jgi:hypothetical protein
MRGGGGDLGRNGGGGGVIYVDRRGKNRRLKTFFLRVVFHH